MVGDPRIPEEGLGRGSAPRPQPHLLGGFGLALAQHFSIAICCSECDMRCFLGRGGCVGGGIFRVNTLAFVAGDEKRGSWSRIS